MANANPVKSNSKEFSDLDDQYRKECAEEVQINKLNGPRDFELLKNPIFQCYFDCWLRKFGLINSNGFNATSEFIPVDKREEIEKKVTKCTGPRLANETDCLWGFRNYGCLSPDSIIMAILL